MIDPAEFWADPEAFRGQGIDNFIDMCLPRAYFGFKEYSHRIVRAVLAHAPLDYSITELGCSVGRNLYHINGVGYLNVTGVEVNPEACDLAHEWIDERQPEGKIAIVNLSIQEYLRRGHPSDVIFTQSVLMHIPPGDEWVFELMAESARKFIVTHEVEKVSDKWSDFRFSRDYKQVFEGLHGFREIEYTCYGPQTLRVFRKEK